MTPDDAPAPTLADPGLDLDAFLAAFEAAAVGGGDPDPAAFLPPPSHPLYPTVLRELLRVDLEFAWSRGDHRRVEDYRGRFPDLFRDPDAVRDLAGEEYRLRKAAGERPDPREYRDRLGVIIAGSSIDSITPTRLGDVPVEWPADRAPQVGDTIPPGYHLDAELGRGAFGRVYLARESGLGGRPVAVKVSARPAGEPLTLARLQHTNVVPVYAAHKVGRFTALVMPFLGRTTLADLIAALRDGRTPQSGRGMVSTLAECGRSTAGVPAESVPPEPAPAPGVSRALLDALEKMTFAEAVLWIGAELADGLAHAHDRGILHRDVKPANVLLTDDGRPMLLDFNLSAAAEQVGGTLAYMAPEQLEAARSNRGVGSPQTDVYALGVVLVELLTGHHPFPQPRGGWEESLAEMGAARRRPLAGIAFPADVTPGVRAILEKCLAPDPADRYASAADLREDLNRQRTHQPLRFAREGSVREHVRKWARRHPRLSSGAVLVTLAALVVAGVTTAFLARQRHLGLLEAKDAYAGLREVRELAQAGLALGPGGAEGEWSGVRSAAEAALGPYRVERDDWFNCPLVTRLPQAEQATLRRDASEVMFRTAEATAALAASQPSGRAKLLEEAAEWNRRARVGYPGTPPRTFAAQEARLLRALGRGDEAKRAGAEALTAPEPVKDDPAAAGLAALTEKRWAEAAEKLRVVARTGTPRYAVWMGLAAAERKLGRLAAQIDALAAATALRPSSPWPFYHRGVARLEVNDATGAIDEFDRFLELKRDDPDGLLNRAAARHRLGDHRGAVADLDRAERLGSTRTRVLALRSEAKRALRDAGAARDRAAFLAKTPTDALSWTVRGEFKRDGTPPDAAGALKDFDAALDLDPEFLPALRNKAHLLSEDPGRVAEAVAVLDAVLRLAPTSVGDRAGRAVLLARLGRTKEARDEVEACAPRADGMTCYQLASAALVAGDTPRGLALLRTALRKDPALAAGMPADPDLKSVWKDPVFLNLTAAAGTLSRD